MAANAFMYSNIESRFGDAVSALLVHPNRKIAYVGRGLSSHRARLNLGVLRLSAQPDPRWVRDTAESEDGLLPIGDQSSVYALCLHRSLRTLYVLTHRAPTWKNGEPTRSLELVTYALDDAGEIVGRPTQVAIPTMPPHAALIAHPTQDRLYLGGNHGPRNEDVANLYVLGTDATGGVTSLVPLTDRRSNKPYYLPPTGLAIRPDGTVLYVAYQDHGFALEALPLDNDGTHFDRERIGRHMFTDDEPGLFGGDRPRLHLASSAIYPHYERRQNGKVVVLDLDSTGMPATQRSIDGIPSRTVVASNDATSLWFVADATFRDANAVLPANPDIPCGVSLGVVRLDASGRPEGTPAVVSTRYGQPDESTPRNDLVSAFGRTAVMTYRLLLALADAHDQVRDLYRFRFRVLGVAGPSSTEVLSWTLTGFAPSTIGLNQDSSVLALDSALKGKSGPVMFELQVSGSRPIESLSVRIDILAADDSGALHEVKPGGMVETVFGGKVVFFVPGYGFLPPKTSRADFVKLLSQDAKRYVDAASRVAIQFDLRPKRFLVGCYHLFGRQGQLGQLRDFAESMKQIGVNCADAYEWGSTPRAQIEETLAAAGLEWIQKSSPMMSEIEVLGERVDGTFDSTAEYRDPPAGIPCYFDAHLAKFDAQVTAWATYMASTAWIDSGRPASAVKKFAFADEPSWVFDELRPGQFRDWIASDASFLAAFRGFLQRTFPDSSWSDAVPWGAAQQPDTTPDNLPERRLYYATMRFFTEECSKGFGRVAERLQSAFGHPLCCHPNLNTPGWFTYMLGANKVHMRGGPDPFDIARKSPHVSLWTEDWFRDAQAENWSIAADLLRSAKAQGGAAIGGYVVGERIGTPAGASYKVLSLVGKGAKVIDFYTWGPAPLPDSWSENAPAYGSIADAMRLLGRAEHLLFPGEPPRGRVAIHCVGASPLWDRPRGLDIDMLYADEPGRLHTALVHAGYSVDFVDDVDLAGGALEARAYSALYLAGPNLSARAQSAVSVWVTKRGGVVAVLPGAAVADETNQPCETITGLLGLQPRSAARVQQRLWIPDLETIARFDHSAFGDAPVALVAMNAIDTSSVVERARLPPLRPMDGVQVSVCARLSSGGAAITMRHFGAGKAIAYAFFPGQQYHWTPTRGDLPESLQSLPSGWGEAQRRLAVAPAVIAGTPKPVRTTAPLVEALPLTSAVGTAVVLLNWSGAPVNQLIVSVPRPTLDHAPKASSARGVALTQSLTEIEVTVNLQRLETVDVLMIE